MEQDSSLAPRGQLKYPCVPSPPLHSPSSATLLHITLHIHPRKTDGRGSVSYSFSYFILITCTYHSPACTYPFNSSYVFTRTQTFSHTFNKKDAIIPQTKVQPGGPTCSLQTTANRWPLHSTSEDSHRYQSVYSPSFKIPALLSEPR